MHRTFKKRKKVIMSKRSKLSNKASRRIFTAAGLKTNSLNLRPNPMRGGFRI